MFTRIALNWNWKSVISVVGVVAMLSGCTTWGYKLRTGNRVYPRVPAQQVEILFAPPTDREYATIGFCSVLGGTLAPDTDMLRKLRKCAADLGADAVILQKEGTAFATFPGTATTVGPIGAETTMIWGPTVAAYPKNRGIAIKYLP